MIWTQPGRMRRTRLTWADGNYIRYDYNVVGAMTAVRENGATSGVGVVASFAYDDLGRRTTLTRGNGTVTRYGFDAASRLTALTQDLAGTASDQTLGFTYNPAGQIATRTSGNDGYAYTGTYNVDRSYGVNGLNQLTSAGSTALGYDARGNLTTSGSSSYSYTSENRMAVGLGVGLAYDPLDRLFNVTESGVNTTLLYDGADVIAEVEQNNGATALRRYVHGPGSDEPLVWYEGTGLGDRRWLHADERGSVVAVTNAAGNATTINRYDEFGIPASANGGRFQYTGQKWLSTVGLYDYKARMYSPTLGRFLQTDPIGYGDGLNWYNYVGGDPVNFTDPSELGYCPGVGAANASANRATNYHDPSSKANGPLIPPGCTEDEIGPDVVVMADSLSSGYVGGFLSAWGSGLGVGGGGGEAPAPASEKVEPKPCRPTDNQLANSGRVTFRFAEGSATLLATSGDAWGTFETAGGYSGTFHVSFDGGMVGIKGFGAAYGRGSSQSLATFKGVNYNIVGALGPYSFSDNFDPNTGSHVGQTDAASTIGLRLGVTRSVTEILTIRCSS